MNIFYFDDSIPMNELCDIYQPLKEKFGDNIIALPSSTQLMIDVPAETLFDIQCKIAVALEKVKEERPEEYQHAYNNMYVHLRDKQWKKMIDKTTKK